MMDRPDMPFSDLLAAVRRIIGNDAYGMDDDLLSCGLESLQLVEIAELLSAALQEDVRINDIWAERTLTALLAQAKARPRPGGGAAKALSPRSRRRLAAPQQRRFCAVHRPLVTGLSQVVSCQLTVSAATDLAAANNFLRYLLDKYDALRTTFEEDGEQVWQIDVAEPDAVAEQLDIGGSGDDWRRGYLDFLAAESARIYDPRRWPLFRCHLIRAPGQRLFSFHGHHLVFDGVSRTILRDEARVLSMAAPVMAQASERLAFNYSDYANWANERAAGPSHRRAAAYWRHVFDGDFRPLHLTAESDARAAGYVFLLGVPLATALREAAQRLGTTPFTLLVAAFLSYLLQDHEDVTLGIPSAGRDHPQARRLIGMFTNTILVRARRGEAASFAGLVRTVHERLISAQEHQEFQYDEIVRMLGLPFAHDRLALTGLYFNMVKEDLRVRPSDAGHGVHYRIGGGMIAELMMHYQEQAGDLIFNVRYRSALFSEEAIAAYCRGFARHLEQRLAGD